MKHIATIVILTLVAVSDCRIVKIQKQLDRIEINTQPPPPIRPTIYLQMLTATNHDTCVTNMIIQSNFKQ